MAGGLLVILRGGLRGGRGLGGGKRGVGGLIGICGFGGKAGGWVWVRSWLGFGMGGWFRAFWECSWRIGGFALDFGSSGWVKRQVKWFA